MEQGLADLLPPGQHVVRGEVEHLDRGGGVAQYLQNFFLIPGLQRVEGGVTDEVVPVLAEENEDFDLLVDRDGQGSLGAFAPDDLGGLALP